MKMQAVRMNSFLNADIIVSILTNEGCVVFSYKVVDVYKLLETVMPTISITLSFHIPLFSVVCNLLNSYNRIWNLPKYLCNLQLRENRSCQNRDLLGNCKFFLFLFALNY